MEYCSGRTSESELLPVLMFEDTDRAAKESLQQQQIVCLKCDVGFEFPSQRDDYLAHLYLCHRLVIADVEDIPLLEEYLEYWQKEFQSHELQEYCTTMLLDQLPDGTPAKNEKYYLLCDILPKDYELRETLRKKRLQEVLAQHQFELTDRNFSQECLYCRDVISGLRSAYLEHLFTKHFLQLGKPENLVFIDELLAKVRSNLERLICLYCEKVFKDRVTLKEHMRKKAHKRINPNNHAYDKYFLINYREHGKQGVHAAPRQHNKQLKRYNIPNKAKKNSADRKIANNETESVDFERRFGGSDDSDSDWSDWSGEQTQPLNCLFCTEQTNDFAALKGHMLSEHMLDFDASVKDLNFYQKIKIVNYVRRQMCLLRCVSCDLRCDSRAQLLQHLVEEKHFTLGTPRQWDKPEYFFPTYEDDGLLCILDDSPNDDVDDTVNVRVISEDTVAQINKEAERLSLENFKFL